MKSTNNFPLYIIIVYLLTLQSKEQTHSSISVSIDPPFYGRFIYLKNSTIIGFYSSGFISISKSTNPTYDQITFNETYSISSLSSRIVTLNNKAYIACAFNMNTKTHLIEINLDTGYISSYNEPSIPIFSDNINYCGITETPDNKIIISYISNENNYLLLQFNPEDKHLSLVKDYDKLETYWEEQKIFGCEYFSILKSILCITSKTIEYSVNLYVIDPLTHEINSPETLNLESSNTEPGYARIHKATEDTPIIIYRINSDGNENIDIYYISNIAEDDSSFIPSVNILNQYTKVTTIENVLNYSESDFFIMFTYDSDTSQSNCFLSLYTKSSTTEVKESGSVLIGDHNEDFIQLIKSNDKKNFIIIKYKKDTKLIEITEVEMLQCNNKNDNLWVEEKETFLINELYLNDKSYDNISIRFINFTQEEVIEIFAIETETNIETSINTDDDFKGFTFKFLEPNKLSEYSLNYHIYLQYDTLQIISSACKTTFILKECFPTCFKCYEIGDANENKCVKCLDNYYFISGTTNCASQYEPGYYYDEGTLKQCHSNCFTCTGEGSNSNNKCVKCANMLIQKSFYTNLPQDEENCVQFCDPDYFSWYINNDGDIECSLDENICPDDHPYLNSDTRECLSTCVESSNCTLKVKNTTESIIKVLKNNASMLFDYSDQIEGTNCKMTLYKSMEYNITIKKNSSLLYLNDCDRKLRDAYNLSDSIKFKIAILDIYNNNNSTITNQVEYLIYTENGQLLNLSICNDTNINIETPISDVNVNVNLHLVDELKEEGIDLFNKNDSFFYDYCRPYQTKNKTDLIVQDRQNFFFQNVSLCDDNCQYVSYEPDKKIITCSCVPKVDMGSDLISRTLPQSFKQTLTSSNLKLFKCQKVFFSSKTLYTFGFYFNLVLIIANIVNFGFFVFVKDKFLLPQKNVSAPKLRIDKSKINPNNNNNNNNNNKNNSIGGFSLSSLPINQQNSSNIADSIKIYNNSSCGVDSSEIKQFNIPEHITEVVTNDDHINKLLISLEKADNMKYLKITQYYNNEMKLVKMIIENNPFYMAFLNKTIPRVQRHFQITMLIMNVSMNMSFNSLFYSDYYISEYNKNGQSYKLYLEIPKMFYSYLLFALFNLFFKILSTIEKPKQKELNNEQVKEYIMRYIYRFIVFFFSIFVLSFIFLYFQSIFCYIYPSNVPNLITSALISIICSFIVVPTGFSLAIFIIQKAFIKFKSAFFFAIGEIFKIFK